MASDSSSSEPIFNIASVKLCTEALGPFRRMAIWFQGCDIGCPGCCNPELQPIVRRNIVSLEELVSAAERSRDSNGIEGVTFIGGEPTMQDGLKDLALRLRECGLGTILFTGRDVEDLPEDLVSAVDLIIDGRYVREDADLERTLIGSRNQRILDISGRYARNLDWFTDSRRYFIEVDVDGDGFLTNGSTFREQIPRLRMGIRRVRTPPQRRALARLMHALAKHELLMTDCSNHCASKSEIRDIVVANGGPGLSEDEDIQTLRSEDLLGHTHHIILGYGIYC